MEQKYKGLTRKYVNVLQTAQTLEPSNIYQRYARPLINKAEDYYISIDRFKIPLTTIPLFIFNNTPNYYYVNLTFNNNSFQSGQIPLTFIPWCDNLLPSNQAYYYVYHFDTFIKMINKAIAQAFVVLQGLTSLPGGARPPYFDISLPNFLLHYYAQEAYYEEDATASTKFQLYCNNHLVQFLTGMPVEYNALNYNSCRILCINKQINMNIPSTGYLQMTTNSGQDTLIKWNLCSGILFQSDSINITTEELPHTNNTNNTDLNCKGILANFDIIYTTPKPLELQYFADEYKKIDLNGVQAIDVIDLKLFWYSKDNVAYPLYLGHGETYTVRFVFIKKGTE